MNASEAVGPDRGSQGDDGHDALLRTFMEFDLDAALSDLGRSPLWDLRAAATFLTDRMATFAVREEQELRPRSPEREATELEHALLREEVARFVTEIDAWEEATPAASDDARRRLIRTVHRIEMVLAVHREGTLDRAGAIAILKPRRIRGGRVIFFEGARITLEAHIAGHGPHATHDQPGVGSHPASGKVPATRLPSSHRGTRAKRSSRSSTRRCTSRVPGRWSSPRNPRPGPGCPTGPTPCSALGSLWSHPGKKLLFMGGGFAQWKEWNVDAGMEWLHQVPTPGPERMLACCSPRSWCSSSGPSR